MERYTRNILIEDFGSQGQEKLTRARVLVIGAGGLGSPVLLYLAAAGVGKLGIVDFDVVDITNLQRQVLHAESDLGIPKTESAKHSVKALNPNVEIVTHSDRFSQENATGLVEQYDFVVDCSDNYETKFLINDICVAVGKPYSHGAILAMRGEAMTYIPGHADYRRFFPEPPEEGSVPLASQAGVLGSVAGVIGSIQATEVIKYFTGIGELLTDRLLVFDGRAMIFNVLKI